MQPTNQTQPQSQPSAASQWMTGHYGTPQGQESSQGNFLTRLLPTAGSILGGIGGAFIPGLGETGVGEIGGASVGSALGQGLQDMLTGKTASVNDLGTAALEGGIGQATGMGAAKALGAGAGVLSKMVSSNAAKATDAIAAAPFKGIESSAVAKANDLKGTADLMKSLGVDATPQAWQEAASVGTGRQGLGAATTAMDSIVNKSGQLPANGLSGRVTTALQNAGVDTTSKDLAFLHNDLGNITTSGTMGADGKMMSGTLNTAHAAGAKIAEQVDPSGLMQVLQKVDGQISAYHNPNVQLNVQDGMKLQGLQNVKSELENTLYGNGLDAAVAGHTVDGATATKILDAAGGNQKLADYITNGINNAQTGAELRAVQAPLVRASILGKAADFQAGGQLPGTLEGQTANALDKATGEIVPPGAAQVAALLHPGAGFAVKVASTLGDKGMQIASSAVNRVPAGLLPLLTQIGAHAPSMGSTPDNGNGIMEQGNQSMNPYATQAATSPGLASDMVLASLGGHSDLQGSLQAMLQRSQQGNAASQLLQGVEGAYGQAGGGQGLGSGVLNQLSSFIPGTAAYQYNAQKMAAASALSKATGIDAHTILSMLPSLTADQQGAQQDFNSLQGATNQMQAPSHLGGTVLSGL